MYSNRADAMKKLTDAIDTAAVSEEWDDHFAPPAGLITVDGDSGVLEPGTRAKILQGALEALDRAKEQILRQQMSVIVFDSNAKHYVALLRDQPDVLNDPVLFEMGPYSPEAEDTMHTNDAVDTMTSWVLLIC
ncbi:hypothetical protein EDD21DRAFT_401166 [Dissophora ornata]|nr:hypothetical protein EDD21DRAFT_401166 [Dissophora ornata]